MKKTFHVLVIPALLAASSLAHAQSAGTWLLRGGVTHVSPSVSSDNMTSPSFANSKLSMDSSTRVSGGVSYMLSDNLSLDVPVFAPFKHELAGDGALAGVGKLAETKAVPISLIGQWRFMAPNDSFRPYVGLGLTYAKFYDEHATSTLSAITGGSPASPTSLTLKSKWVPTLQLGATMALNERWFVDANYSYTDLKTTAHLSTGQTVDMTLNPSAFAVSVGYRF